MPLSPTTIHIINHYFANFPSQANYKLSSLTLHV